MMTIIPEKIKEQWTSSLDFVLKQTEYEAAFMLIILEDKFEIFVARGDLPEDISEGEVIQLNFLHQQFTSYEAVPIEWPNGNVFGTLCLGGRKSIESMDVEMLLLEQKKSFDNSLSAIFQEEKRTILERRLWKSHQELKQNARFDEETGVFSHSAFNDDLYRELHRSRRYGRDLSLILIELIKKDEEDKNDEPHSSLQVVSACVKRNLRSTDIAGRYDNMMLAIILTETANGECLTVADRFSVQLTKSLKDMQAWGCVIGAASFNYTENPEDFISRCKKALYQAKKMGPGSVQFDQFEIALEKSE